MTANGDPDLEKRAGALGPSALRERFLDALARDDKDAALGALQAGFDFFNRRDIDSILELLDPDVIWEIPPRFLIPGPHRGHAEVREHIEGWFDSMDELHLEVEDVFRHGDELLLFVLQRGRGRASGVELENRGAHVWTVRGGKIVRVRIFPTREEALEAVGMAAK